MEQTKHTCTHTQKILLTEFQALNSSPVFTVGNTRSLLINTLHLTMTQQKIFNTHNNLHKQIHAHLYHV